MSAILKRRRRERAAAAKEAQDAAAAKSVNTPAPPAPKIEPVGLKRAVLRAEERAQKEREVSQDLPS